MNSITESVKKQHLNLPVPLVQALCAADLD